MRRLSADFDHAERESPRLLLPRSDYDQNLGFLSFYALSVSDVRSISVPDKPLWTTCLNSCGDWLMVLDKDDSNLYMLNTESRPQKCIPLPLLTTFPEVKPMLNDNPCAPGEAFNQYSAKGIPRNVLRPHGEFGRFYYRKALLASSISTVMVIHRGSQRKLAFAREGDIAWTPIKRLYYIQDIMYNKGRFLALDGPGNLAIIDLDEKGADGEFKVYENVAKPIPKDPESDAAAIGIVPGHSSFETLRSTRCLFELFGKPHQVLRVQLLGANGRYKTWRFKVYELVHDVSPKKLRRKPKPKRKLGRWAEVTDLRGHSIFVGCNDAFPVSACDFPGLMPNCIYFTDTLDPYFPERKSTDEGIYNLETGRFSTFYSGGGRCSLSSPRLVWHMPNRSSSRAAGEYYGEMETEGEEHSDIKEENGKENRKIEKKEFKRKREAEGSKEKRGEGKHRRKRGKGHRLAGSDVWLSMSHQV